MSVEGQITVLCSCGKKLKAPAASAGKKARCPACGAVMVLTLGMSAAPAIPIPPVRNVPGKSPPTSKSPAAKKIDQNDDGLGALYELSEQASTAAAVPDARACPTCHARMPGDAVICTNCGFDVRTGKSLAFSKPSKPGRGAKLGKTGIDYASTPEGSFIIGLLIAGGFGVVWGIIWVVLEVVIGFFITIPIAALLGWTIGIGMRLGQKGYSRRGGIAAAIIAVLAIAWLNFLVMILALTMSHGQYVWQIGFNGLPGLTIISIAVGLGSAYSTANGASL